MHAEINIYDSNAIRVQRHQVGTTESIFEYRASYPVSIAGGHVWRGFTFAHDIVAEPMITDEQRYKKQYNNLVTIFNLSPNPPIILKRWDSLSESTRVKYRALFNAMDLYEKDKFKS